jgi:hypothetical protein
MVEGQFGSKILQNYTPPVQSLFDEKNAFENAMAVVANGGGSQKVEIDGKKVTITDPGRSGRQASTDGKIDSEF